MRFVVGVEVIQRCNDALHVEERQHTRSCRQPVRETCILMQDGSARGEVADAAIAEPATTRGDIGMFCDAGIRPRPMDKLSVTKFRGDLSTTGMGISVKRGALMLNRKTCTTLALILILAASPLLGAETESDPHHSAGAGAAANSSLIPGCMTWEAESGMPMMRMMMDQDGIRMMAEHIEGRLASLKIELKITDQQLPLWNAFTQVMRDNATAMQAMPHTMMGKNKAATLPDKLAAREIMLAARLEAVRKLKTAAGPLYMALDTDQKKTADEIMLGPMGVTM